MFSHLSEYVILQLRETRPRQFTRTTGQNVTFNCRADIDSGSNEEHFQLKRVWFKDGHFIGPLLDDGLVIGKDRRYRFQGDISREEASIFKIKNIQSVDKGSYECLVWAVGPDNQTMSANYSATYMLNVDSHKEDISTTNNFTPIVVTTADNEDYEILNNTEEKSEEVDNTSSTNMSNEESSEFYDDNIDERNIALNCELITREYSTTKDLKTIRIFSISAVQQGIVWCVGEYHLGFERTNITCSFGTSGQTEMSMEGK